MNSEGRSTDRGDCLLLTTLYCIQLHRTTVVVSTKDVMLITSLIRILLVFPSKIKELIYFRCL
jgi:hypothetical protein